MPKRRSSRSSESVKHSNRRSSRPRQSETTSSESQRRRRRPTLPPCVRRRLMRSRGCRKPSRKRKKINDKEKLRRGSRPRSSSLRTKRKSKTA